MNHRWSEDRNKMALKALQMLAHHKEYLEPITPQTVIDYSIAAFNWTRAMAEDVWTDVARMTHKDLEQMK